MRLLDRLRAWWRRASGAVEDDASDPAASAEDEIDPFNPFPEPLTIEITDVFDLHTIAPRDVKQVVLEYLEQARRRRFKSVRLIHGKGIGVQREMVRKILAHTSFVKDFTDAPPQAGGWGATIAHLSTDDE